MLIKPVKKNLFDVFFGQGWENWSRFEVKGTYLKKVGGNNLSPANIAAVKEVVYGNK